jgi:hypothetical protein
VIRASELASVLAAGRKRTEKEAGFFASLRAGATTVDLLSLDGSPVERA